MMASGFLRTVHELPDVHDPVAGDRWQAQAMDGMRWQAMAGDGLQVMDGRHMRWMAGDGWQAQAMDGR